jgi:glycosyltransferase involved in cell wall biosynthesis
MTDVVVISLEAWDSVWRRNQHLISRLLKGDETMRVLFVEPPADPLHELRSGRRPALGRRVRERRDVQPRLWTLLPLKAHPRRIERGADRRFARSVMRAARRLGMTEPVLWVNDPAAAEVSRATRWPTLYDITDDWAVADRPERTQQRVIAGEQYLLHNAAQVVACSAELVRRKTPDRPAELPPIALIPNGVDVELYRRPTERPADLPAGKVAMYVGTLHADRLDVPLCVQTAQALDETATVVFVGPNALGESDTRALRDAGVVLLGARPHEQVPAYLQHADVLLVPHLVNAFTDSLDPLKLYEYQAVGRPVVSTAVAGFRDSDGTQITAAGTSTFVGAVADALMPRTPAAPAVEVLGIDWITRTSAMAAALSGVLRAAPPY